MLVVVIILVVSIMHHANRYHFVCAKDVSMSVPIAQRSRNTNNTLRRVTSSRDQVYNNLRSSTVIVFRHGLFFVVHHKRGDRNTPVTEEVLIWITKILDSYFFCQLKEILM